MVDAITKGITSGLSLLALAVTALLVSPIAAVALLVAVLLLGFTLQPLRRLVRRTSRGSADTGLDFATEISEVSGLGQEIQIFGVEHTVNQRVDDVIVANSRALRRQSFVAFLFTPMYATVLLLLLVGALGAIRASGTGDLASLGAVMVMMIRSLAYAQLAQAVYGTLQASQPYLADLSEQLDAYRSDAVDRSGIDSADFEFVEFRDVGFSYSPDGFGLTDVNFRVDVGESIGIIGPSGSGKSTLVQLLLRLRTPTSGSIFASGVPANEIAIDGWRRRVAFVPQDAKLINGTISDN
ncbi:MAG: ABC transporter ATP-binding protein/permease, partial [Roseibium sp.]|uniref:ABC transporter ATP-binding protein/permease n=1 Tax=Roseibium sp. TaxID=1936156 RepID=UPI0032979AF4